MKLTSSFQTVISLLLLGQNNIETQSVISEASPNIPGAGALFSQWIDDSNAASYQTVPRFWSNTVATSPKDHGVGSRSAGRAPFGTGFPDDSQGNKYYGETGILPPEDGDTKSLLNTLRKTSNSFAIADNSSTPTPRANLAEEQASREQDSPTGKLKVSGLIPLPSWQLTTLMTKKVTRFWPLKRLNRYPVLLRPWQMPKRLICRSGLNLTWI